MLFILCGCSSVVEHQPSKLDMWVRFPSPAYARVAQLVERDLAKVEAAGSSPVSRFFYFLKIKSRTLFRKCPTFSLLNFFCFYVEN